MKTKNKTMAVPSFKRDSPSIRVPSFLLAPNSFNRATTATGSVALTTTPNRKASFHPQSLNPMSIALRPLTIPPVRKSANKIPGIAKIAALPTVFLKVCTSIAKAASKINMGRKINKITCGSIVPAQCNALLRVCQK